jgi:hypothetical protein
MARRTSWILRAERLPLEPETENDEDACDMQVTLLLLSNSYLRQSD